ncbi:SPOC domain-like protein [Rhodocollybia butyracea]|uniref:ATP-dependent DNA helicase II subunit 2 n=1 Tax=Rhodocollybia butyracea TaxID=206335 RepID=A0A9P5Q5H1_9AGAR|nr:SPOC domain-like protein [Rhodocollybia butyracea]
MPAERAGYTVTMFVVDVCKSMGATKTIPLPPGPNGEQRSSEVTHLQYALQYVKFKIQDMIYNGRKTDQCGVIIFGTEDTDNRINDENGGYENVTEYITIAQPTAETLKRLDELKPSDVYGDPIDALIVAVEAQNLYLGNKKTWTRKVILVTDGEGPIELEDWEVTAAKMNELNVALTVVGVEFDDEEYEFKQKNKPHYKEVNEQFYNDQLCNPENEGVKNSVVGTLDRVLEDISMPEVRTHAKCLADWRCRYSREEAMEILIKTSKCISINRPKPFKKFYIRPKISAGGNAEEHDMEVDVDEDEPKNITFAQLKGRTEYYVDMAEPKDGEEEEGKGKEKVKEEEMIEDGDEIASTLEKVEKEELIRGFKYGTSYVPCPDGQFSKLPTKKGIDVVGFVAEKKFRREYSMGEVQYIWANPDNSTAQCALSAMVQAMYEKGVLAVGRWVTGDGRDAKMGIMSPTLFDKVHCLLWAPMPFADDVRKHTFPSLSVIKNKKGETLTEHPYIPTENQSEAMDEFVDSLDLMEAGLKDEESGKRTEWFDIRDSYNPAYHRLKQAMFHCAIVADIDTNPLPPPHPELLKYFNPPKKLLKKAQSTIDECIQAFNVKHVPKAAKMVRKGGHSHANDDDEEMLLLDRNPSTSKHSQSHAQSEVAQELEKAGGENDTEDEDGELLLDKVGPAQTPHPLPTPARSLSSFSPQDQDDDAMDIDPQRDANRIIGRTHPLTDFKDNLKRGDIVTKAVEDMCMVIAEVVIAPFASRRKDEMIECLTELREVCLKEDEIEQWNAFIPNLKQKCLHSTPGNEEFWTEVQDVGRELSLISDREAKKSGGSSNISEVEAMKFMVT